VEPILRKWFRQLNVPNDAILVLQYAQNGPIVILGETATAIVRQHQMKQTEHVLVAPKFSFLSVLKHVHIIVRQQLKPNVQIATIYRVLDTAEEGFAAHANLVLPHPHQ